MPLAIDYREAPPMFRITDTHFAATWLLDPRAPKVAPPLEGSGMNDEILLSVEHLDAQLFPRGAA